MEQGEAARREVETISRQAKELQQVMEGQVKELADRETALGKNLAELEHDRDQLTDGIEELALSRYERLLRHKGENAIVGIEHGVCGGCHMKLPAQILLSCRGGQELVTCLNCGRILYYTRDMDLAVAD
jgi:hypothetical protein